MRDLAAHPGLLSLNTATVRERYDEEQKIRLLALLWQVVEADEHIARFEQAFADWVAQAVGLTPVEWKRAKSLGGED